VPARAGSKGLPNKNVLPCAGKPLIAWTIEAAVSARHIKSVLVSTDSPEIADVARKYGAWVPFMRNPDLATDEASMVDVIKDVLRQMEIQGFSFDLVALLQPTSPLRNSTHIDKACEEFIRRASDSEDTLASVMAIDRKYNWIFGRDEKHGHLYSLTGLDMTNPRRQELTDCFIPNGAIFIADASNFSGFYGKRVFPYIMDERSSMDIDYLEDLKKAEKLLSQNSIT